MHHILLFAMYWALTLSWAQPEKDLLRGPEVPAVVRERIGGEDSNGRFQRVEGRPEFVAVTVLTLSPKVRDEIRALAQDRATRVTMHLVDELDLVRELSDAVAAGQSDVAQRHLVDLWRRLEPDNPHAPCAAEVELLLTAPQRTAYRRVLDDYWDRWIRSEARAMDAGQTRERLAMTLFQEEVRVGYERSLRHYRQSMDGIFGAVAPTDLQREAIRGRVIEHIKATRLEATSDQRRSVMLEIYAMLDEDRRVKFFDYLLRAVIPDGDPG